MKYPAPDKPSVEFRRDAKTGDYLWLYDPTRNQDFRRIMVQVVKSNKGFLYIPHPAGARIFYRKFGNPVVLGFGEALGYGSEALLLGRQDYPGPILPRDIAAMSAALSECEDPDVLREVAALLLVGRML